MTRAAAFAVLGMGLLVGGQARAESALFDVCLSAANQTAPVSPGARVRLISGSVQRTATSVSITGTASYSVANCAPGNVAVNDIGQPWTLRDATITLERTPTGSAQVTGPAVSVSGKASTGANVGVKVGGKEMSAATTANVGATLQPNVTVEQGFVSVKAKGKLELPVPNAAQPIVVEDFSFELSTQTGGVVRAQAGRLSLYACALPLSPGGSIDRQGVTVSGTMSCDGTEISNAVVRVAPDGRLSGAGYIKYAGAKMDATLGMDGSSFVANAGWKGTSSGFVPIPGTIGVELQVKNPIASLKLERKAGGGRITQSITGSFDADRIEVRTQAKMPNGEPWASAYVDPGPTTLSASAVTLALPSLPAPADALKAARDTCLRAADLVKDNPATTKSNEHNAAVDACNAANPSPPANPSLPASVSMDLGKIAK